MTNREDGYGGDATIEKLDAFRRYADLFTKALRDKPSRDERFTLEYVDAFAGRGTVKIQRGVYAGTTVPGSAQIALEIDNRPFDRLLFIDKARPNVEALRALIDNGRDQDRASVRQGDTNVLIPEFCARIARADHRMHRALVFVDPFATQMNWTTLEAIARTQRCDLLILVPVMAVRRLIKTDGLPHAEHATALDRIFGDDSWRSLYAEDDRSAFSARRFRPIVDLYVQRMDTIFARVVDPRRLLRSESDHSLFTLIGAASNPHSVDLVERLMAGALKAARGPQGRMPL